MLYAKRACRVRAPAHGTRVVFLALVVLLGLPAVARAENPPIRQGFFLGGGLGGGSAATTTDGETSDREGGAGVSLRLGYAFTPQLGLGLESNGWAKSENGVTVTFTTYTAALSFFQEGLVLRAGVGGGDVSVEETVHSTKATVTQSGFGLTAGAAYEFRVARKFAIGPQVDYGYVKVEGLRANSVNVGLSMNWYFIP